MAGTAWCRTYWIDADLQLQGILGGIAVAVDLRLLQQLSAADLLGQPGGIAKTQVQAQGTVADGRTSGRGDTPATAGHRGSSTAVDTDLHAGAWLPTAFACPATWLTCATPWMLLMPPVVLAPVVPALPLLLSSV